MSPKRLRSLLIASLAALCSLSGCTQAHSREDKDSGPPSIRLNPVFGDITRASFDVTGLPAAALEQLLAVDRTQEEWNALLAVTVNEDGGVLADAQRPPIVGKYAVQGGVVRFVPRFPLERGLRYQARFDPSRVPGKHGISGGVITALYRLPKAKPKAATRVVRIDPTLDVLPENQLKFYITFSAPMGRGDVYRHLHLLGPNDKPVEMPFLELGEELWDRSGTRLTLLFDPGRIKRGLKPREDVGPVLEQGKRYTFVIDREWEDADGNPLERRVEKRFRAGPPDETSPDPKTWRIEPPRIGTREALLVRVPESLDRALLASLLSVKGPTGSNLEGEVTVDDDARAWRFSPSDPWKAGRFELVIGTELEDLAGNSVARPFEVDVFEKIPVAKPAAAFVSVPFEPRERK
jgi:hypothetical protein